MFTYPRDVDIYLILFVGDFLVYSLNTYLKLAEKSLKVTIEKYLQEIVKYIE